MCGSVRWSHPLSTLIKSILRYRQQAIVLHLLVDEIAMRITSLLFTTWQLPAESSIKLALSRLNSCNEHFAVKVIFYNVSQYMDRVSWIPNRHYSGRYSFLKLILSEILPNDVEKILQVIALDTDALLMDDIAQLWSFFSKMTNLQAIGLVENLSDWYLFNASVQERSVWPAWGRGFNSGVILLDLAKLRSIVIKDHQWIVQKLPCEWNFQLGFQSQQDLCSVEISRLKQQEDSTIGKVSEYDDNDDGCGKIRHARWIVYRTLLYVRPYNFTTSPKHVVLTTQFSVDRLMHFDALLQYWSGPVSAAVYISDSELSLLTQFFDDTLANRTNVALHAVYKEGTHYPINYLRNVALNNSNDASFVFLADVDFIPRPGLYPMLCEKLETTDLLNKKAFVVPAFEYVGSHVPSVPHTKNALLAELNARRMQIFRRDLWIQGHAATDYDRWMRTDQEYSVLWRSDYEPYVVVRRSRLPPYDQRFVGFGWNKVSHAMSLNAAGYEFVVLPDAFLVHQPHLPSLEMARYRLLAMYRKCLKALKGEFVRDLIREQKRSRMSNFPADSYQPTVVPF
uniref:Uncharacterized protein n=1 Tax=Setaria digitata TaxID=48799 RepID=A0A915PL69_9BILA